MSVEGLQFFRNVHYRTSMIIFAILGALLLGSSIGKYIEHTKNNETHMVLLYNFNFNCILEAIFGFFVLILGTLGAIRATSIGKKPVLIAYVVAVFVGLLIGVVATGIVLVVPPHLQSREEVAETLRLYGKDSLNNTRIDKTQAYYECCGVALPGLDSSWRVYNTTFYNSTKLPSSCCPSHGTTAGNCTGPVAFQSDCYSEFKSMEVVDVLVFQIYTATLAGLTFAVFFVFLIVLLTYRKETEAVTGN